MSSFIKFANLAGKEGYSNIVDAAEAFQFNFSIGKGNEPPQVKPVTRRIQTWNKEKTQLWQASPELFAANRRKPYQGWAKFRPHILKGFDLYSKTAQHKKAVTLGMHYVNRIEVDLSKNKPSDFIVFLPPEVAFADDIVNFGCQTEQEFKDAGRITIIAGNDISSEKGLAVVLNIIYTVKSPSLESNKLKETIEKAHSRIIGAFEKSITDLQRERMEAI